MYWILVKGWLLIVISGERSNLNNWTKQLASLMLPADSAPYLLLLQRQDRTLQWAHCPHLANLKRALKWQISYFGDTARNCMVHNSFGEYRR